MYVQNIPPLMENLLKIDFWISGDIHSVKFENKKNLYIYCFLLFFFFFFLTIIVNKNR